MILLNNTNNTIKMPFNMKALHVYTIDNNFQLPHHANDYQIGDYSNKISYPSGYKYRSPTIFDIILTNHHSNLLFEFNIQNIKFLLENNKQQILNNFSDLWIFGYYENKIMIIEQNNTTRYCTSNYNSQIPLIGCIVEDFSLKHFNELTSNDFDKIPNINSFKFLILGIHDPVESPGFN